MRDKLITIFNRMKLIETKGDSTLYMADCLKDLVEVINSDFFNQEDTTPYGSNLDEEII